jgi:hypothetical protein
MFRIVFCRLYRKDGENKTRVGSSTGWQIEKEKGRAKQQQNKVGKNSRPKVFLLREHGRQLEQTRYQRS